MAERSKELLQVGFYLSKFGKKNPPATLGVTKWKDAYKLFYKSLSEGRSLTEFEHSLNNSRDGFDGYFPHTEREGWKGKDGLPSKLTGISLSTFEDFDNLNENEIYLKITQGNNRDTWAKVPVQDFTSDSDIDWSKSIPEIDKQLYAKYGLTQEEIGFIESMIKPMG